MKTPVIDFITEYENAQTTRLHMPGHKAQALLGFEGRDITEIKGAGELYESTGPVGEAEAYTAELFGSAKTCWSTEGSSQCIRAMLAMTREQGIRTLETDSAARPYILAARNVHRSFLTACALLDLDIEWLWPEKSEYTLCSCPVTARQVNERLIACDILPIAVYLTSPDYLGGLQDIQGIADVCHKYGVPLLVDNAHGAYLKFLPTSLHPLDLGADLCCDSAHKTLPAVTGCAYLHISKAAPTSFAEIAKKYMALFGSTSPSWLLLQSLDKCNELLATEYPAALTTCVERLTKLKEKLSNAGWVLLDVDNPTCGTEFDEFTVVKCNPTTADAKETGYAFSAVEPLKLTINATASGCTGPELADALRTHNIECEYADPDYVVLMPSPYNTDEDWTRLEEALLGGNTAPTASTATTTNVASTANTATTQNAPVALKPRLTQTTTNFTLHPPKRVLTPRQAMLAPSTTVPVEQAVGKVLATGTLSCPPAVSVITAGELITEDALPVLKHYGVTEVEVVNQLKW